jgi:hypothetical protein
MGKVSHFDAQFCTRCNVYGTSNSPHIYELTTTLPVKTIRATRLKHKRRSPSLAKNPTNYHPIPTKLLMMPIVR